MPIFHSNDVFPYVEQMDRKLGVNFRSWSVDLTTKAKNEKKI